MTDIFLIGTDMGFLRTYSWVLNNLSDRIRFQNSDLLCKTLYPPTLWFPAVDEVGLENG
jgi:hypothetical protein